MRRLRARLPLGPVVVDPLGPALADDDRRRMLHPAAGGVILFSRNYESPEQLQALTEEDCCCMLYPVVGGVILFSRNYESSEQL